MGIVIRQGLKTAVTNVIGIAIGFVATIYIYPKDLAAKGLMDYLLFVSSIFLPYANLGNVEVLSKFFPKYISNDRNYGSFLSWILKIMLIQIAIFSFVFLLLRKQLSIWLYDLHIDPNGIFLKYSGFIIIIIFLLVVRMFVGQISLNKMRAVVPNLVMSVLQKIVYPIIIVAKIYFELDYDFVAYSVIYYLLFSIFVLLFYVYKIGGLKFAAIDKNLIDKPLRKEMQKFSLYCSFNSLGGQFVYQLDTLMVSSMTNFSTGGLYSSISFIAFVIGIPLKSILNITAPKLSVDFERKDYAEVQKFYQKSSHNLLFIGIFSFIVIYSCLPSILSITQDSKVLLSGLGVFFFLGLSQIIEIYSGVNQFIITFSEYFKYNLLIIILVGVINSILNYIFISQYGILGASIATLISITVYAFARILFLYYTMGMYPFINQSGYIAILGGLVFIGSKYFVAPFILFEGLIGASISGLLSLIFVTIFFAIPCYIFHWIPDLSDLIHKFLDKNFPTLPYNRKPK